MVQDEGRGGQTAVAAQDCSPELPEPRRLDGDREAGARQPLRERVSGEGRI